ncbi:MAG: PQQ-binding-like beta-propeller repeat protein, partial [Acidobacteriota bacterium]
MAGVLLLSAPVVVLGQAWSQWRGAERDGVSDGAAWPDALDAEAIRQVWQADGLGPSYSSPVVNDGVVYTTEGVDSTFESVVAFDQGTGERLWTRTWSVQFVMPQFMESHGNWPKSTPSVDGDDLLFLGIDERLHCLDAETGEPRWSVDFPRQFKTPIPEFGSSTSPLISGDSIFVQAAGSLLALDRRTGEVRWRA